MNDSQELPDYGDFIKIISGPHEGKRGYIIGTSPDDSNSFAIAVDSDEDPSLCHTLAQDVKLLRRNGGIDAIRVGDYSFGSFNFLGMAATDSREDGEFVPYFDIDPESPIGRLPRPWIFLELTGRTQYLIIKKQSSFFLMHFMDETWLCYGSIEFRQDFLPWI
jgi:hypothetical protein